MKAIIQRIRTAAMFAVLFAIGLASTAWAEITNPVTGQKESYVNTFTGGSDGTGTEWNDEGNWDTSKKPFISGANAYTSALVDGKTVSTTTSIDGWNLAVGAYNKAAVTFGTLGKIQGDSTMWLTVDGTSSITINGWGGGNLGQNGKVFSYYVAAQNGVTWSVNLASGTDQGLTMNYYLAKNGSVSYKSLEKCSHVIKAADVTLSGTSRVEPKILVSFTSTTKTFTADAAIKVYDTDGTTLKETVAVTSVRSSGAAIQNTTSVLNTANAVGTCELVQCTDGIVLYYVDGDPSAVVAKTYTPSININFTSGTALSTAADVGLAGYAVPGTSWNNLSVANNATLSSLNKIDSTGAATASSASVTITNTRGEWHCSSLVATSDLRAGYIDETADVTTPTVTVSGIPYDQYKVVVYTATDAANVAFGYVTINGTDYTYANGAVAEGTAAWGASGAQNTAEALAEGVNVLVSPVVSGGTLTVVGHRSGTNPRGCIAAVQIVKVEQEVGENDLLIELDGDRTYTFDEAKAYSGTVYVLGEGTLTFDGTASTAETLHIGPVASVNIVGSALTPAAVTGNGTAIYDGAQPSTTLGFDDSDNWFGTVWVKNVGDTSKGEATGAKVTTRLGSDTADATSNELNKWGNANSFVKFTNVRGYMATANVPWTLILEDDSSNYAWYNNEGWTARTITIAGLKGDGTFWDVNDGGTRPFLNFTDASQFTGAIHATGKQVFLSGAGTGNASDLSAGRITVPANQTLTIASGKTWHTRNGLVVNGTLNVNGTLASDSTTAAVSGSGTVVFTGRAPTPTGDTWWKNANWTGTVELNAATAIAGWEFNNYGHSGSTLRLNNCRGWLKNNYTCIPALEIGGTFTWNDGSSGLGNTFKVGTLKGSGTISIPTGGAGTAVWQITDDWSGFTGAVVGNNTDGRRVLVFGSTLPATIAAGEIYVSEGATLNLGNASATWWTLGKGFVVDGTVVSPNRDKWGGGTAMTLGDTGVLELTSAANTQDYKDYSGVTGTGTIKYSSTAGWRLFPDTSAKMPATTLTIQTELADSLIIACTSDTVIGNLAGSKNIRSDWGDNSANGRTLTVTQSKDTEWSGKFVSNRITQFNVNPGASTTGTLTLSGTQTISMPATISGSVNLTGTWVGATTVAGTFGGTGTLTGNLTFSDGATFKAFASDENGLAVSGTITYPSEGTVTVDVSALEQTGTKVLMTASDLDVSKFALASGQSGTLSVDGNALKVSFTTYVAEYGGVPYETVQAAINAAVLDGHTFADVKILDNTATCPAEYYIDTENNNILAMCQAAIVKTDSSKVYFKTAQLAFDDIDKHILGNVIYDYFEVYTGAGVVVTVNPAKMAWNVLSVRVKCLNDATVDVTLASTEYELTEGDADANGIVTYMKTDKATTYVWTGNADNVWNKAANWAVGTASGATASRSPSSVDTAAVNGSASITVTTVSVAGLQVSGTVTFTGVQASITSASPITLGANDTISLTDVTLSPVPTTTVENSYVKATPSDSTTTYRVDAYNTVTFAGDNYTLGSVMTNGAAVAVSESTCKVEDGAITFTVAPNNGYAVTGVTAGNETLIADNGTYSYTATQDATITVTTVSTSLTIGAATVEYLADYSKAKTVSATVTAGTVLEGTEWTLKTNGVAVADATVTYADGTVTFSDISVTLGDSITYSIEASNGSTGTSAESAASTVGNVTGGWIVEDKDNSGSTGAWTTGLTYTDGVATITDANTYTPTKPGNGIVTLETVVKFGNEADSEVAVGDGAQAAVKIANGKFAVYGKTASNDTAGWQSTEVAADVEATYTVKLIINYNTGTFTISVKKNGAETATPLGGTWYLATAATKVSSIAYKGTGAFTSLNGSFISGDVGVTVDAANVAVSRAFISAYLDGKTVAEAAAALNPNATVTDANKNGLNYFTSYALGLDPTKEEDKPIVDVTTDAEGKFVFKVKHPVYNEQGEIIGYEEINAADNVTTTVTLKYGTDANTQSWESAEGTSFAPNALPFGENNNVLYYKAEVTISAK